MSDSDLKKRVSVFKDAVAWDLPSVQGSVVNRSIQPNRLNTLDDVRTFEEKIKKQIEAIKNKKDNPTYLTVTQIQDIQKQAYDEAYKQGYDEAFKKATADSEEYFIKETAVQRQELKQKAQQLQNAFTALAAPLNEISTELEQQLTEMVFFLCKNILETELSINPAHITYVLQQAIARLPVAQQRNVLIKLNPKDIQLLEESNIDIKEQAWALKADESIKAGGCLIESDAVRIDRQLDTRLKELAEQLFTGLDMPDLEADESVDAGSHEQTTENNNQSQSVDDKLAGDSLPDQPDE